MTLLLVAALLSDSATIRLFEQADGPVLPPERRAYSTRFDAARTRMVGVEIAAPHGAGAAASGPIECTLTTPDGNELRAERAMKPGGAELLWGGPPGWRWDAGRYAIECRAGGRPAGHAEFEIAENPPEVTEGDIRVAALRVFPVAEMLPPRPERRYATTLAAGETRHIGIEIEFSHAPLGRTPKISVDCWFFWPDGQTSPPLELGYEPEPDWAGGYAAGAMGFPSAGQWSKGVYAVACAIHGQPVAVDRFELE